jgi:hypothetical protein
MRLTNSTALFAALACLELQLRGDRHTRTFKGAYPWQSPLLYALRRDKGERPLAVFCQLDDWEKRCAMRGHQRLTSAAGGALGVIPAAALR